MACSGVRCACADGVCNKRTDARRRENVQSRTAVRCSGAMTSGVLAQVLFVVAAIETAFAAVPVVAGVVSLGVVVEERDGLLYNY